MKCLLIKARDLALNDIVWGIRELGYDCQAFSMDCDTIEFNESAVSAIETYLDDYHADIVFTMNFAPSVSRACQNKGIPYASWIYDSPIQSLYNDEAFNDINYFFLFDKDLLKIQKDRGLKNLFYLPLAANVSRMGKMVLTNEDELNYSCDISFVGMQYVDGRYAYYNNNLPLEYQNELNSIAYGVIGRWDGRDHLRNTMSDGLLEKMLNLSDELPFDKLGVPNRIYFEEVVIARAIAYTERRLMMERIRELHPRWYGADADPKDQIEGVEYLPRLYYADTLPKAYNLCKINLSTCLHSISSGVPLRLFDIIGAGGFILTNYQPEIEELFKIGEEIITYHNFDEMYELAKFFLTHEQARLNILLAGYERVCSEYNYPTAVNKMIKTVF